MTRMGNDWNVAMNVEDAVDGRDPPPRLTGEEIARLMEAECEAEAKAHALINELGEDAFVEAFDHSMSVEQYRQEFPKNEVVPVEMHA